jgi:monofunctional glycosyltransferase
LIISKFLRWAARNLRAAFFYLLISKNQCIFEKFFKEDIPGKLKKFYQNYNFRACFFWLLAAVKAIVICFFALSIYYTVCFSFIRPQRTPLMLIRSIDQLTDNKDAKTLHKWVSIEHISPNLVRAVVASEDNNFTRHYGIDFGAIKKARDFNKRSTRRKRGASTISQQTAKNIFLWPDRSYLRKGFEVYFTILIETFWSKKRIMEVYLNMIEMGPGIYGAEAAAKQYFHKSAAKLTKGEAALIAISLPNPRKRNPARPSAYMYRRQQEILYLMPKIGKIEF